MRKLTIFVAFSMLANFVFGGGLLTNYNQSVQYDRMLSRGASLEIDAVFYNPAGLTKMKDGWHFNLNSQTIFQDKIIESDFPLLNDGYYKGITKVPVFPTAYAAYKKNKWAFSFGFGPTSGGGTAEYLRGLPAFEIPISQSQTLLSALGVTGYNTDIYFKGNSVFWGIQLGATYEINEKLAVFGGVRYVTAKNTYIGHIKDIEFQVGGAGYIPAPAFLNEASGVMQTFANMPQTLSPYLEAGGSYTLPQLEGAGMIDAAQKGGIEAGLKLAGLAQEQINLMTLNQINMVYVVASPTFQGQSDQLSATAGQMEDRKVDTEQTGDSFIPILGLNYSPNDDWNFGFKWEMKTFLTLDNKPNPDNNFDLWEDKVYNDIPSIISAGVGYRGLDWLEAQLSYTLYLDQRVGWGPNINDYAVWGTVDQSKIRAKEIENNLYELGLGFQFNLSEKFAVSVGGMQTKSGVADSWQDDLNYNISFFTLGGGIMWNITNNLSLDLAVSTVFYQDDKVSFEYPGYPNKSGQPITSYSNNYSKESLIFGVGLSYSIF